MRKFLSLLIGVVALACASRSAPRPDAAGPHPIAPSFAWTGTDLIVADSAVAQAPTGRAAPRFPPDERVRGIEAAFVTAFILDTMGHVEMPSVSFVGDAPSAFARAVCEYYKSARFAPARLDQAATRAIVVHPWTFGLTGGKWERTTIDARPVRTRLQNEGPGAALTELRPLPHCVPS